jgi:ribonucleoside-triphosphate reductase (thioredoxin)
MEHVNGIEFHLNDTFLAKYKRRQPDFGPLGYFVYKRTYARPGEEWWRTIQRVVEGCYLIQKIHCSLIKVPWSERKAKQSAQIMYDLIWNMKFLPPGRGLWAMGTPFVFEHGAASLQNCAFVSTKDLAEEFSAPFAWLMTMSMHGVGVGFDTEGSFGRETHLRKPRTSSDVHEVEDSREGWVEAFRRLLDAFSNRHTLPARWDFSQIRPEGAPIRGFGGICPGSKPLEQLISKATALLESYANTERAVDSALIVDLMNLAGEAVVSGGIRRSAELALGRLSDEEFMGLKVEGAVTDPRYARWASNNSVVVQVGSNYAAAAALSAENGEPGFVWLDNCRAYGRIADGKSNRDYRVAGVNPCGEQTLESYELCNLVETFPSRHADLNEYLHTIKYAYLYAKAVTLLPTHDPRTNAVMMRNRRIGVSQTGIVENIQKVGFRAHIDWCETAYQRIRHWDSLYSDWLCVPRSIKVTTVKPSGTVSLLPGCTPGIHFPHAEFYLRRVRVSKSSDIWPIMEEAGYLVEPDAYERQNTMVISFPVHEPHFVKRKQDVSIWEQLELAAAMQAKWSDNAVSVTVTVRPEEARDLPMALAMYEKRLKTVSFLPLRGDQIYAQAPYEEITREQYEKLAAQISRFKLAVASEDRVDEKFCDTEKCEVL